MQHVQALRGTPQRIQVDNGSEFISVALDQWAYEQGVTLDFSRPGKPTDNAFIESFNDSLRDECLNVHGLLSLADVRDKIERWRQDYNEFRRYSSLGDRTPSEFRLAHLEAGNLDCPGVSRQIPASRRGPFEGLGTDAAQVTMAAGAVVKSFNVVEHV